MIRSVWTAERLIVVAALLALCVLSWVYLWAVPMPMPGGDARLTPSFVLLTFLMWFVMMIAMMTSAVLPVVLLFQRIVQRSSAPLLRTLLFAGGYFAAWCAFSLLATLLQCGLMRISWIDAMGVAHRTVVSAGLLAAVGIYQWLPVKRVCLEHCRSPVDFLTRHFRRSALGASLTGLQHGLYCIGCCWLLMMLLFVGGVMNLLWVAGITLAVTMEKLMSRGRGMQRAIGAGLVIAAVVVLVRS